MQISDVPTSKVCHKCAYELDKCNAFIEKVNDSRNDFNSQQLACFLCSGSVNDLIYFDLSNKSDQSDYFIEKIYLLQNLFTTKVSCWYN